MDLLNLDADFHGHLKGMVSEVIVNGTWNLPAVLSDVGDIKDRVDDIVLPFTQLPDVLVWRHTSDGSLSSKHASIFMRPRTHMLPWADLIWNSAIPPSHSFIYWRLHHGKMPTDDNLRSRGCIVVSVYNLCLNTDESSEHLFLRCPFDTRLWNWIGGKLNCIIDYSLVDSLLLCRPTRCSSQVSDIFLAVVLHTLHTIWWARNSLQFSVVTPSLHSTKVRIHSYVAMYGNVSKGKCLPSDFALIDSSAVPHHCRRVKEIILVLRKAPTSPWLKVNTDGSVVGGHAACGGLFCDHLGTFHGAFYCNVGLQSVFYAEVLGIIFAIEYVAQEGWRNIWLESDSSSALLIFSNSLLVPIMLRNRWHNARRLGIQVISFHIFREGNCCADKLAAMGHSIVGAVGLDNLPPKLRLDFFRDRCGFPNYRIP